MINCERMLAWLMHLQRFVVLFLVCYRSLTNKTNCEPHISPLVSLARGWCVVTYSPLRVVRRNAEDAEDEHFVLILSCQR